MRLPAVGPRGTPLNKCQEFSDGELMRFGTGFMTAICRASQSQARAVRAQNLPRSARARMQDHLLRESSPDWGKTGTALLMRRGFSL
jgi:hypothetical protein